MRSKKSQNFEALGFHAAEICVTRIVEIHFGLAIAVLADWLELAVFPRAVITNPRDLSYLGAFWPYSSAFA
ncbi:MAG: hypothetical protein ACRESZ_06370 [Methylococcales bacterium]